MRKHTGQEDCPYDCDCERLGHAEDRTTADAIRTAEAAYEAGRKAGEEAAVARYHALLQNIDAWVDLDVPEHPDLRAAVVAALENCPPACTSPECEAAGFERGRAVGRIEGLEMAEHHFADTEARSAEAHAVYQTEAHRRGDVRHPDAYADLSEATKEWDRVLVRWVERAIRALKEKA